MLLGWECHGCREVTQARTPIQKAPLCCPHCGEKILKRIEAAVLYEPSKGLYEETDAKNKQKEKTYDPVDSYGEDDSTSWYMSIRR